MLLVVDSDAAPDLESSGSEVAQWVRLLGVDINLCPDYALM